MRYLRNKWQANRTHYVFNAELLANLDKKTGCKRISISQLCNVQKSKVTRWCQNGNLPVWALIRICNDIGVRPSAFIGMSDGNSIKFNPVPTKRRTFSFTFNHEALACNFGKEISWNLAQQRMGCNFESLKSWTSEKSDVKDLIRICNELRWNIGDFIDDDTLLKLTDTLLTRTEMLIRIAELEDQLSELRSHLSYSHQGQLVAQLNVAEDNQSSLS